MKKKNGFVFIETMVTIVILATALLAMYSLFTNMLVNEKRRVYYDDPIYVYRANYLIDIFKERFFFASNNELNPDQHINMEDILIDNDDTGTPYKAYLRSFSCDNDIFNDEYYSSKKDCRQFFYEQRLYRVYISQFDLSYMDTCEKSNDVKCFDYRLLGDQAKKYLRTLSYFPNGDGYYFIFEFNEDGNGNVCSNNNCMHEFAAIKYGGKNQVINLND